MRLAATAGALATAAGVAGFRLVPDSELYARAGWHFWPSPLGGLAGTAAGMVGVIAMSAIAVAIAVQLVPARSRLLFAAVCAYWFAFPGVDALGLVFVLLMLRHPARARLGWLGAAAAHPVAAVTSAPLLWRRDELGVGLVAVLTIAAIVGVGLYDGFSTTDRYALPLVGTLAMVRA
jgi:hypothetical protein